MPPPPPSPPAQVRVLGTLIVIIIRAKHLPNRVRIGKQNPYATVTYGLHKKRTAVIERGGQQPEWDAEFRFEILREGLGGEEQVAAETAALVNSQGGVGGGPAVPGKDGAGVGGKTSLLTSPQTTGYPPGKRVLKLACWADDAREPKLIGEGEMDIEPTIKAGQRDEWIKLERKGRYAGEVYIESTWYSNEPRPAKPARREASNGSPGREPSTYGGAGSHIAAEEYEHSEESGTESWDGGSQVGLSGPGASNPPPVDLGADYPDADLAPLNRSMSAMAISRSPLPLPPTSMPSSQSAYHVHSLSASQSFHELPPMAVSHTPVPHGSYGYDDGRRSSFPTPGGSYTPAPPQHQPYGGYQPGAGEFGTYQPAQGYSAQPSTYSHPQQQPLGEFERLAQQHYASQRYSQNPSSRPLPQPYPSSTPAPPHQQYDSISASSYPPPQPSQTPYLPQPPQPPLPPIPPSGSPYWQEPPPPPPNMTPLPSTGSYSTMPASESSRTIYASSQPTFSSPPPPPSSIPNSYSSFAPPPQPPLPPQPPQPPAFSPPPVFSPPPPPSLQGGPAYPPSGQYDPPSSYQTFPPAVPPLPPATPQQYASPPQPPPLPPSLQQQPHYAGPSPPPSASPYGYATTAYPASPGAYTPAPAPGGDYPPPSPASTSSPYGTMQSSRPPLPQPPASAAGHRPLPGMFSRPG
ncbi:hypothetical protein JCM8547_000739 [Rhodosporidiobolus lusitaniae]